MAKTDKVECPTCGGTGVDPGGGRYTEQPQCKTCGGEGSISPAKASGIEAAQAADAEPEPELEPEPEKQGVERN